MKKKALPAKVTSLRGGKSAAARAAKAIERTHTIKVSAGTLRALQEVAPHLHAVYGAGPALPVVEPGEVVTSLIAYFMLSQANARLEDEHVRRLSARKREGRPR